MNRIKIQILQPELVSTFFKCLQRAAGHIGEDGVPILLVGGRSGYVIAYRVLDGIPQKVREFYL
jgi:hypothetical protein